MIQLHSLSTTLEFMTKQFIHIIIFLLYVYLSSHKRKPEYLVTKKGTFVIQIEHFLRFFNL